MKAISAVSAGIFAVCGFLWGQLDGLFYALITFLTSILQTREFQSSKMPEKSDFRYHRNCLTFPDS